MKNFKNNQQELENLALSDFKLMMKEFREQRLQDTFKTKFLTDDFRVRWSKHPQLGLWLETAWHVGYQFQLGILEQISKQNIKNDRAASYDMELHWPFVGKMQEIREEVETHFTVRSTQSVAEKIKSRNNSSEDAEVFKKVDEKDVKVYEMDWPCSLSQEKGSTKKRFMAEVYSTISSLLNESLTPESLLEKRLKNQGLGKDKTLSFNLTLMDCLQLLEVYQHADPGIWNQSRVSHRQTWMAEQWEANSVASNRSLWGNSKMNCFYCMSSWFALHLLPPSLLTTVNSYSSFNSIIESQLVSSAYYPFVYYEDEEDRHMINSGLYKDRSVLMKDEKSLEKAQRVGRIKVLNTVDDCMLEFFNPHLWKSLSLEAMLDHYTQLKLSSVLNLGNSELKMSVDHSDRDRLERFRKMAQWLQEVVRKGIPSVKIEGTSIGLEVPLNTLEKKLDPFLGVTQAQWNNLGVSMNPENFETDRDLEMVKLQWIECWIENQTSEHRRKIRSDIRKNLKAKKTSDQRNQDADPILHEIFQTLTGQTLSDDAQGSMRLKQKFENNNLSSAGWKALHKNTSFQELMLRNLMSTEEWRRRQLSLKQKNGEVKLSTKDRGILLQQQRLKNLQSLKVHWMNEVLTASAEYGFSNSDTQVLMELIGYNDVSDWIFNQGVISLSDVVSMSDQDWAQWRDGVEAEHHQRQGLWKVWMKDAVDTFEKKGGLDIKSLRNAIRSIQDVQRAEAPYDFFTQLATQYKKTPFRSALKWHEDWIKRMNQQKMEAKSDVCWMTPWVQMQETLKKEDSKLVEDQGLSEWLKHLDKVKVQELNSERLLAQEGLLMHHCVGSSYFSSESKKQSIMIFHLHNKMTDLGCTLTLERGESDEWKVQQNKGKYNAEVKDQDLLKVTKAIKDQINRYEKVYKTKAIKKTIR